MITVICSALKGVIETDNAPDTVDLNIEMLLPTITSMKIFLVAEQSPLRRTLFTMPRLAFCGPNSFVHSSDIVVGHSNSSHLS